MKIKNKNNYLNNKLKYLYNKTIKFNHLFDL